MIIVEYDSNNSGGGWWLDDDDWFALQDAGWTVHWFKEYADPPFAIQENGRFLGALAMGAHKRFESLDEGIDEWERITGEDSTEEGCECCGIPHTFYAFTEEQWAHYRPHLAGEKD